MEPSRQNPTVGAPSPEMGGGEKDGETEKGGGEKDGMGVVYRFDGMEEGWSTSDSESEGGRGKTGRRLLSAEIGVWQCVCVEGWEVGWGGYVCVCV